MTDSEPTDVDDPAAYDHLRPTDPDRSGVDPGIYRVVGTGDPVALLRVGDADGRRVNSGDVVAVERDRLDGFEPADNPDGNRPTGERLAGVLDSLAWQVRAFLAGLRARPIASLVALAVVLVGVFGEGRVPGPDFVPTVLVVGGALGLSYIASNRPD